MEKEHEVIFSIPQYVLDSALCCHINWANVELSDRGMRSSWNEECPASLSSAGLPVGSLAGFSCWEGGHILAHLAEWKTTACGQMLGVSLVIRKQSSTWQLFIVLLLCAVGQGTWEREWKPGAGLLGLPLGSHQLGDVGEHHFSVLFALAEEWGGLAHHQGLVHSNSH